MQLDPMQVDLLFTGLYHHLFALRIRSVLKEVRNFFKNFSSTEAFQCLAGAVYILSTPSPSQLMQTDQLPSALEPKEAWPA